MEGISEAAELLFEEESEANWKKFAAALKRSDARYYKVVFEKGKLDNEEDLRSSYAELYDEREGLITKVPIFKKLDKNRIEGATIYLKGLVVLNK